MPSRTLKTAVLATIFVTAFAGNALANQIQITLNSNYRTGSGGEFTVNAADPAAITGMGVVLPGYDSDTKAVGIPLSFQTFCIEKDEFLTDGAVFDYDVTSGAIEGGVAGGNPDPISMATAYLYQQFATGNLAYDYTPGSGRQTSAGLLQEAIWYFEDELTVAEAAVASTNSYVVSMISQFTDLAGAKADANGAYGVFALNLTQGTGADRFKQDQLVYGDLTTITTTSVPDGGLTLMMLGAGLSGLAVLRRQRR